MVRRSVWRELRDALSLVVDDSMMIGESIVRGVLFDFDGTLTRPGAIDFAAIKLAIRCPPELQILEYLATLAGPAGDRAWAILEACENEAAARSVPNEGAEALVEWLTRQDLALGILTRNSRRSLDLAFRNFQRVALGDFAVVMTRDDVDQPKPHPEGVLVAAARLGLAPRELLVVGDYVFDVQAGQQAGARTAFLVSDHTRRLPDPPADLTIRRLDELRALWGPGP